MTDIPGEQLRRSINALERVHAVLIGFAMTASVRIALESWLRPAGAGGALTPPDWPTLLLFAAFFFTVIPFFHGAVRHLDAVYLYARSPIQFHLLADFVLLFVEALVFVTMAESVDTPPQFIYTVWALLAIDTLWGFATIAMSHFGHSGDADQKPASLSHVWKWIRWNATSAAAMLLLALIRPRNVEAWLCAGAFLRSATDYYFNRAAYFGSLEATAEVEPARVKPASA